MSPIKLVSEKVMDEESRSPFSQAGQHELVEHMCAYQSGDFQAFDELYTRLAPKLRGYLNSMTWDASRSEDLLQESFLQIHRSRRTYIPPRPVRPWVFAIARYVFLMDQRSAVRRRRIEAPAYYELPDVPVPASMEGFADRDSVRRALKALNPTGREALLLHHVWGMSFGEIGRLLGIREGTAKLRAHRGMHNLRQILEQM